jgi:hypothetical protein
MPGCAMPTAQPHRHAGHHQRGRQTASGTTSPRQAPAARTHRTSQAPQTPGQANRPVGHHGSRRRGASRTSRRSTRSAICCRRYPGEQLCWAACCARTAAWTAEDLAADIRRETGARWLEPAAWFARCNNAGPVRDESPPRHPGPVHVHRRPVSAHSLLARTLAQGGGATA